MPQRVPQPSFTGGELDPSLHARADLAKYNVGVALCKNFIIHAHGGVSNRSGLKYVVACKGYEPTS